MAWDFLKENIPLFDCPDKDINEIYYFRWWTYRKHIEETPDGLHHHGIPSPGRLGGKVQFH